MSPELGPHALLARGGQATRTQPPKKPRRCCWLPPLLASRHPATMTCPSSSSRLALLAPGTPRSVSWVRAPQIPPQAPRGHSCQAAWPWKHSQCSLGFCLGDTSREGSAPSTGGLSRGSSSHSSAFGCSSRHPRPRPRSRRPSTCRAGRPPVLSRVLSRGRRFACWAQVCTVRSSRLSPSGAACPTPPGALRR